MMEIKLERIKVLDIRQTIQSLIFDFQNEIDNENTSDERRKIAQSAINNRWQPLLDEIVNQFEKQDNE